MKTALHPSIKTALAWFVAILIPVVLVMAAVRVLLFPWFLEFEYRTPGFPDDPYLFFLPEHLSPFTLEDRLQHARTAMDYLLNDAGIEFLGDLRFPDGEHAPPLSCQFMDDCTRLYNDRELQHMIDVKEVLQATLRVWYLTMAVLLGFGVWSWFGGWLPEFRRGLIRGGWLTISLIIFILVLVLMAFGIFFHAFHDVFFAPGTWVFYSSDTLIRLFPERFWRDAFIIIGTLSIFFSLLLIKIASRLRR
jgi:integral membrane protein (TIGR01906 family)